MRYVEETSVFAQSRLAFGAARFLHPRRVVALARRPDDERRPAAAFAEIEDIGVELLAPGSRRYRAGKTIFASSPLAAWTVITRTESPGASMSRLIEDSSASTSERKAPSEGRALLLVRQREAQELVDGVVRFRAEGALPSAVGRRRGPAARRRKANGVDAVAQDPTNARASACAARCAGGRRSGKRC